MLIAHDGLKRIKNDDEKLQIKTGLARILLQQGYSSEDVRDIFVFIKHYTSFADSKYLRIFDLEMRQIAHHSTTQPMGIEEYLIAAYREDGLKEGLEKGREKDLEKGREEGIEKGIEKGISLKERDFTLNLWELQAFSLEKISLLVGATDVQVSDTIVTYLKEHGKTKEDALTILAIYRQKFPAPAKGQDTFERLAV